jgi:hypothetical protein
VQLLCLYFQYVAVRRQRNKVLNHVALQGVGARPYACRYTANTTIQGENMTRLLLAAAACAAMCGVTIATVSTEFATSASAAAPAALATIDVYKDAN